MHSGGHATLSTSYRLALLAFSIVGTTIILLPTSYYGIGLNYDSVAFLSWARNLLLGKGSVSFDGIPHTDWPPLYPFLLATISYVFRADPFAIAHIVQAVLFGCMIYLVGMLSVQYFKSVPLAFASAFSALVGVPIVNVTIAGYSETLFFCLTLLHLILLKSYLEKPSTRLLILLSVCAALAWLTRYMGVVLIPMSVISILMFLQDSLRAKFKHIFIFISIATFPLGLWAIRNYLISGTWFGQRLQPERSLFGNVVAGFETLLRFYIPNAFFHLPVVVSVCAIIGFLTSLMIKRHWSAVKASILKQEIFILLLFNVTYVGFLVAVSSTVAATVADRLLSPIFVPTTLLLILFASKVLTSLLAQWLSPKYANLMIVLAAVIVLAGPTMKMSSFFSKVMRNGIDWSNPVFENSAILAYLRQNDLREFDCEVQTNNRYLIYGLTSRVFKHGPQKFQDLASLKGIWPGEDKVCLVWLNKETFKDDVMLPRFWQIDDLRTIANLQPIASFDDGTVYLVTKKE